jgi:DNA replication ATP-dependent helicase Dna2
LCWEGALVHIHNAVFNNTTADGSLIYTVSPDTHPILEPYNPISVTDAVEAAWCIRAADLRNRVGPDETFFIAQGQLVHTLLEYCLINHDRPASDDFEKAFGAALPSFFLSAAGSSKIINLDNLRTDIVDHFQNIRNWISENCRDYNSVEIETDLMSARWGLKGRADAIFHASDKTSVLEIKSGSAAMFAHTLQVLGYSLLTCIDGRLCDNALFYTGTGRSERLDLVDPDLRQALVKGRNRAISLKYHYTKGVVPQTDHQCPKRSRCFFSSTCAEFFPDSSAGAVFKSDRIREYYDYWFTLLSIENWAMDADFSRILDVDSLPARVAENLTIPISGLRINRDEPAYGASPHSHRRNQAIADLKLNDKSPVEISAGEEILVHKGDPCSRETMRGRVLEYDKGVLKVLLKTAFPLRGPEQPPAPGPDGWFFDRMPFSRGRDVSRRALYQFVSRAEPEIVNIIVNEDYESHLRDSNTANEGKDEPREEYSDIPDDLVFAEGICEELNTDQESAVKAALDAEAFHLIHGPPGTGKTRVLARLILACLDKGERILVACPTNVALDRVLTAIMRLGFKDFIRVGGRASASDEFMRAVEAFCNSPVLLQDLASHAADYSAFRDRVDRVPLIGSTAYQCGAHSIFDKQRFDRVIVDEAGQLDEPATLAPLSLGRKFVLGGDHFQLPPVIKTRSAEESGLEKSLFQRIYESCPKRFVSKLKMQYRMNREIQDIPSRLFYENELYPADDVANRRLAIAPNSKQAHIREIVDPNRPVIFVDVAGQDGGKARPEEAAVARDIVKSLLSCGIDAQDIGIITPYRAQQSLITRNLSDLGSPASTISVDTVDRFQGGEREIIILSLSRADEVTSFLADRKRLNVSLSRARSKLILLGHGPVLRGHELFSSILENLETIHVAGNMDS